jgi:hypothetical protein
MVIGKWATRQAASRGIKVKVLKNNNNNNRTDLFRLICCCNFIFGLLRILLDLFLVLFEFSLCYLAFFVLFGCLLCVVNAVILDCLGCLL